MGKLSYSSIATISINYPVTDLILHIKEHYEEGDTLVLCFWDFSSFNTGSITKENTRFVVNQLSKLLNALEIKNHIIYLSDALQRINNDEKISRMFFSSLLNINFEKINKVYGNYKYLRLDNSTLGKMNFIVADYIIALFFDQLYPDLSKGEKIKVYFSSERFLGVKSEIEEAVSRGSAIEFPQVNYWKKIPILNHSTKEWISSTMSKKEIESEIKVNWPIKDETIIDLVSVGLRLKNNSLTEKINSFIQKIGKLNDEIKIREIVDIFYSYFYNIKKLIQSAEEGNIKKITYVNTKEKFKKIIGNINPAKFEILRYCDGERTVEDIINAVSIKESSVRTYLSKMKNENLITHSKKPLRLVDEIIVAFEV